MAGRRTRKTKSGKRFKAYKRALQLARTPNSDTPPSLTATSPLGKYQAYQSGSVEVSYPRAEESKQGQMLLVSVKPFALDADTTNLAIVRFSNRASVALGNFVSTCGHVAVDEDAGHATRIGFIPARVIVRRPLSTIPAGADPLSQITGVPYPKRKTSSYTAPYGQGSGTGLNNDISQRAALIAASPDNSIVSFRSEVF